MNGSENIGVLSSGIVQSNKPTLNPNLRDFWTAKHAPDGRPVRHRVLEGGRSSSKTWDAGGWAVFLACNFKLRICCTRQFQARIDESVYALLKIQIERFGLSGEFNIQRDRIVNIRTGSEFLFYGLWRSIDEVKGLEGIDILWIEEAHNLTEDQWEKLNPTIRKEGSQIWIIFNPQLITDFVYRRFITNPPPGTLHRKINYDENPFLSKTMLDVIEAAHAEDIDDFAHQYLGEPRQDDDSVIIKRSWVMASIDAHLALGWSVTGRKRIGFDIADDGADKCANVHAHGSLVDWADMWKGKEDELLMSCTRTYKAAQERKASIVYDSIGVGASAGAKFGELNTSNYGNTITYSKFNAGGAIWRPEAIYSGATKNKDQFMNIKAQAWWMVADRFRNTYNAVRNGHKFPEDQMISLSSSLSHLNLLIDELSTPKREFDNNGRVKVESKKDLQKREVASPNLADALIMAFAPGMDPMVISDQALLEMAGNRSR